MILSRELGKRIWGGSTNMENGGGGVSGDYIAGLLTGYAKESWVDEHYISIDFFSRLFQAHGTENGSEIDVMPNDLETTITSVESMFGFWTNLYISALGSNGAAPAGISLGMLTDVVISGTPSAGQVLTFDAVTQKWVNGNAQAGVTALANLTDVTLTSLQANQILIYDATTQKWVNSSVKTINGNSIIGTGDINVGGGGGAYLPLSGGTLTGDLYVTNIIWPNQMVENMSPTAFLTFIRNNAVNGLSFTLTENMPFLSKSGGTMTGDLGVTNIKWPTGMPPQNTAPEYFTTFIGDNAVNGLTYTYIDNMPFVKKTGGTIQGNVISSTNNILEINIYNTEDWGCVTSFHNNNLGAGNHLQFNLGVSKSQYNEVAYSFYYAGTGSIYNRAGIGFYGVGELFIVRADGNVGIGTTSPSYKLHVSGTIYATGAITALSDARKKDITGEAGVTVEQIAHAPAVQFLWKDKERRKDGQQVGTLAQYWQTVLPEVVSDKGGELSMQYGVAALVSAIVTARKVVDHELRILELEKENERLKEEISQLRLN